MLNNHLFQKFKLILNNKFNNLINIFLTSVLTIYLQLKLIKDNIFNYLINNLT
jgi:hypothetical protein